tara:strand:- start:347 stop:940 length:594 start_codon:yes stop_codon:yes gene_type:complete
MVRTNSNFVALGSLLKEFNLVNVNSANKENYNYASLDDRHLLIMFICAHCPYVKFLEDSISKLSKSINDSVQIVAISSNDITTYPEDSPDQLAKQAKLNGWDFPYLYDQDQTFAKQLKAACTPDFYLFNYVKNQFRLFYHGQLDGSRPSNQIPKTCEDILYAVDSIKENRKNTFDQIPSLGCNIKWKLGNEPPWFKS